MKIESVDFFYVSMPEILDIGDGSQDALLVRVRAGGFEGWGECEASPLTSIASYYTPMSHSACKPVKYAVEGKQLNDVDDIYKISSGVHENSLDLLQADHTLSGIDIALWDLVGKKLGSPVYELLGYKKTFPKLPYASQLFGDTAEETFEKAVKAHTAGYKAVKFGWGPFGKTSVEDDVSQLKAAREGVGADMYLMIDAGTVWKENVGNAQKRLNVLKEINAYWLEEPFSNGALNAYTQLAEVSSVKLAGGEGCNNFMQARAMIEHSGIRFIQIDAGRIGGITVSKRVADLARKKNITYVNHTFTSHLALSASLQPYAGIESDIICEYPVELKSLALEIGKEKLLPDDDGKIHVPSKPGLGILVNTHALKKYLVDVEISVKNKVIYQTPQL
ncbi:MAG TPA: mandelate racemase/muconate lactonizing enzyme family protein [Chitinophagaceae bacterium]